MCGIVYYFIILKFFDLELIIDKVVYFKVDGCKSLKIKLYYFCFYDFYIMNRKILCNVGEIICILKKIFL